MNSDDRTTHRYTPTPDLEKLDRLASEFERQVRDGKSPMIEDYLTNLVPDLSEILFRDLVAIQFELCDPNNRHQFKNQLFARFPDSQDTIEKGFLKISEHNSEDIDNTQSESTFKQKKRPKEMIGPYRLLEQIGQGGMGTVWLAEQRKPIRRRVALKLANINVDSNNIIARFEAERQALAMMNHENIAKVLDAGATNDGWPYFVMELVHGVSVTEYCDENELTIRERLELFIDVCNAVQHAHQKGIIHRDIKPSNVLVTKHDGKAIPKVIDFGLAKAMQPETGLTDKTLFTQKGAHVGTYLYMSPEQAENSQDVDTRTDVYSLGALLYKILTGSTPLDSKSMQKKIGMQIVELIRSSEPPKPSSRLSGPEDVIAIISKQRKTQPERLTKLIRGDLDWIVMKGLEKDRNRRYETASAFAADLNRYLRHEPVTAGPPSTSYRVRKFVKRNFAAVVTAIILASVLIVGVIGTSGGLVWALIEKAKAERFAESEGQAKIAESEAKEQFRFQFLETKTQRDKANAATYRANRNSRELKTQLDRAEWLNYAAQMKLALTNWSNNKIVNAIQALSLCREEFRGFEHRYLVSSLIQNQKTVFVDSGTSQAIWSPDGTKIATISRLSQITIWNSTSLKKEKSWRVPSMKDQRGNVVYVARMKFHPDGNRLFIQRGKGGRYSRSTGKAIEIWDYETAERLHHFEIEPQFVGNFRFSPDGSQVALMSWTSKTGEGGRVEIVGTLFRFYSSRDGKLIKSFEVPSRATSFCFSPNGTEVLVAVGSEDWPWRGTIRKIEGEIKIKRQRMEELQAKTRHLRIESWNIANSTKSNDIYEDGQYNSWSEQDIRLSPTGKSAVTRNEDRPYFAQSFAEQPRPGFLKFWDLESNELITKSGLRYGEYDFCPNGELIVAADGETNTIKIIRVADLQVVHSWRGHPAQISSLLFSPDGSKVLSAGGNGFKIWETDVRQGPTYFEVGDATQLEYVPDNDLIALFDKQSSTIRLWSSQDDSQKREMQVEPPNGYSGKRSCIAFDDSGAFAMAHHKSLTLFDGQWSKTKTIENVHQNSVACLDLSTDGKRVVTCAGWQYQMTNPKKGNIARGVVKIWDTESGKLVHQITNEGPDRNFNDVEFSPDGNLLLAGGLDRKVWLWDVNTVELRHCLVGHTQEIVAVAFDQTGKRFATAASYLPLSNDNAEVLVWDSDTGALVFGFTLPARDIKCVRFSADGNRLFALAGARIHVYELFTGTKLLTIRNAGAADILPSNDGTRMYVGGYKFCAFEATGHLDDVPLIGDGGQAQRFFSRGSFQLRTGDFLGAKLSFDQSVRLCEKLFRELQTDFCRKELAQSLHGRAHALDFLGRFNEAAADWQHLESLSRPSELREIRKNHLISLARAGDTEAIAKFEQISKEPIVTAQILHEGAHFMLAMGDDASSNLTAAILMAETACQKETEAKGSNQWKYQDTLAQALLKHGQTANAHAVQLLALSILPEDVPPDVRQEMNRRLADIQETLAENVERQDNESQNN